VKLRQARTRGRGGHCDMLWRWREVSQRRAQPSPFPLVVPVRSGARAAGVIIRFNRPTR